MGPPCLHSALQYGLVNVPFCHGTLQSIFPKHLGHTCHLSSQRHLAWPQCPAGKIHCLLMSRSHLPWALEDTSWLIVGGHQTLQRLSSGPALHFLSPSKSLFILIAFSTTIPVQALFNCHLEYYNCLLTRLLTSTLAPFQCILFITVTNLFIHLIKIYLSSTHYVLGTILCVGNIAVNKTKPWTHTVTYYWERWAISKCLIKC